jgi:hypothetical protein
MSKKHFEVLAAAIATIETMENRLTVAQKVAEVCKTANPKFHYGMFMKACGITVG